MPNAVTPEMVKLLNRGDRRELRAFLTLYAKPIYERAIAITGDEIDAKRVTRRVISEAALLAAKGALEDDVDAQLMQLTDACCSEDLFFARLVDETMRELDAVSVPEAPALPQGHRDLWPAAALEAASAHAPNEAFLREWENTSQALEQGGEQREAAAGAPSRAWQTQNAPDLFEAEDDEDEDDDEDAKKPSPFIVLLIFALALVTVALVWVLLVKLMHLGLLPKYDFGFGEWFNAHVFLLY